MLKPTCDRCGAECQPARFSLRYGQTEEVQGSIYNLYVNVDKTDGEARRNDYSSVPTTKRIDLCSNCYSEFKKFMEGNA